MAQAPRTAAKPTRRKITLADDEAQAYVAVLYYGPNGTGKTTNLAHLAHLGNVAYVRADRSVRKRPLAALGVPVANIEPIDELDTEAIVKMIGGWRSLLADDPTALAGVCIDTTTELIARRLEQIVDAEWKVRLTNARRNHVEPDQDKRYFVDRDYYQPITQEMRRITRQLIDLPCHVGMSAQTRRDVDEDDGKVRVTPAVNPAFSGDLMAYMDFVIRTEAVGFWPDNPDESIFVGYPRHMGKYAGKDREHVLPARLVEPTMDRVIAYVNGTLTKENDERQAAYRDVLAQRRSRRGKRGAAGEED